MKIAFAADMSFSRFTEFPGKEAAQAAMAQPARLFAEADFSVVNLETVFGKKEEHTPILKSGPNLIAMEEFIEYVDALAPNAVGLANNHTFDFGKSALDNTRRLLDERGYPYCGAGDNIARRIAPSCSKRTDSAWPSSRCARMSSAPRGRTLRAVRAMI